MTRVFVFTNLYGCDIGDDVKIGTFVEIQYTPAFFWLLGHIRAAGGLRSTAGTIHS